MSHNPCFECYNRRGYDYNERCENNCLYAEAVASFQRALAENIELENRIDRVTDKMEQWRDAYIKSGDHKSAAIIGNILTSTKVIFGRQ